MDGIYRTLLLIGMLTTSGMAGDFVKKQFEVDGVSYPYQVFVPNDWTALEEYPVILFLHGAGERGSDGREQTEVGLGPAIRAEPDRFPAIVVMPQCRRGAWWNDPAMEQLVLGSLAETMVEYNGDPDRVYLTGLSMGGYGTFYLGAKYPDRFAALVPICGGVVPPRRSAPAGESPYLETARTIGDTPIWIFHGEADPVVPVSESREMVNAFESNGRKVRYTEYPGVGHNSWDRAYAEPGLMTWLLSKRKR